MHRFRHAGPDPAFKKVTFPILRIAIYRQTLFNSSVVYILLGSLSTTFRKIVRILEESEQSPFISRSHSWRSQGKRLESEIFLKISTIFCLVQIL